MGIEKDTYTDEILSGFDLLAFIIFCWSVGYFSKFFVINTVQSGESAIFNPHIRGYCSRTINRHQYRIFFTFLLSFVFSYPESHREVIFASDNDQYVDRWGIISPESISKFL